MTWSDKGWCLDVPGGTIGTEVTVWHCHDGNNQKWLYDGQQRLRPVNAPNLCVDIKYSSTDAKAGLHLWDCHDGANQKWTM